MKCENREIIIFLYVAEYQRTNGCISGTDERAGGTGQGDSHAAGEFSLISYSPTYAFVTFIAQHIICTQVSSSVLAKRSCVRYSRCFIMISLFLLCLVVRSMHKRCEYMKYFFCVHFQKNIFRTCIYIYVIIAIILK